MQLNLTGEIQIFTDFCCLNAQIKCKPFPLPKIPDLLQKLSGFKYTTAIDLSMGYYHIPLDEEWIPEALYKNTPLVGQIPICMTPNGHQKQPQYVPGNHDWNIGRSQVHVHVHWWHTDCVQWYIQGSPSQSMQSLNQTWKKQAFVQMYANASSPKVNSNTWATG